jgi:hypothetical protein
MTISGRARNAPCFCGSGRKLKHCCGRHLKAIRTWKHPRRNCRWRFFTTHDPSERYASELAEHICTGERVFIARGTPYGTSWLMDGEPLSMLAVLDRLPGAHYRWVIDQTLTALGQAAPNSDVSGEKNADTQHTDASIPTEIHGLLIELLRLVRASGELATALDIEHDATQESDLADPGHAPLRLAS